jgi:hypothetical protein
MCDEKKLREELSGIFYDPTGLSSLGPSELYHPTDVLRRDWDEYYSSSINSPSSREERLKKSLSLDIYLP